MTGDEPYFALAAAAVGLTAVAPYSALGVTYIGLAAIAGSVTALSFRGWKEMGRSEIALTLFVSASFAVFAVPWLAHSWFGPHPDISAMAFAIYVGAAGSNVFLPLLFRWVGRRMGPDDGAVK